MRYSVSAQHVVLGFMPGPKCPRQRSRVEETACSVRQRAGSGDQHAGSQMNWRTAELISDEGPVTVQHGRRRTVLLWRLQWTQGPYDAPPLCARTLLHDESSRMCSAIARFSTRRSMLGWQ